MEEVYRISPTVNKFYETATYTHKEGKWPNERYYVPKNKMTYVGKFIEHKQYGYGDGATHIDIFMDNEGKPVYVNYTYEGTTCFREVYPKILPVGMKEELSEKTNSVKKSLANNDFTN